MHKTFVLAAALLAGGLCAAACNRDGSPTEAEAARFAGEVAAFSYPSGLEQEAFEVVDGSAATGCLCNSIPGRGASWIEVESTSLSLGEFDGLRLRSFDASRDEQLTGLFEAGLIPDDTFREMAEVLSIPRTAESGSAKLTFERRDIAGRDAVRFNVSGVPSPGGESVSREDWIIVDAMSRRIHALTCQSSRHAAEMGRACALVVATLDFPAS